MICSICQGEFDIDGEGGVEGFIGMIPVAFCPTCRCGIFDFADQMDPSRFEEEDRDERHPVQ